MEVKQAFATDRRAVITRWVEASHSPWWRRRVQSAGFGNAAAGILEGPTFSIPNLGNAAGDIHSPVTVGHILGIQTDGNASGSGTRLITLEVRVEF